MLGSCCCWGALSCIIVLLLLIESEEKIRLCHSYTSSIDWVSIRSKHVDIPILIYNLIFIIKEETLTSFIVSIDWEIIVAVDCPVMI